MKKQISLMVLLSILFSQQKPVSFESKVGTTAANFLKIGIGPRAIAMGSAFSAIADDATSVFWNPAGIEYIDRFSFYTGFVDWIMDLKLTQFSFVGSHSEIASFAVFVNALQMDNIAVTTLSYPEGNGTYAGASDMVMGFSLAKLLSEFFSLGVSGKIITTKVSNESAMGYAFDIGTVFSPGWKDFRIGMSLMNFGTKMRLDGRDLDIISDINPALGLDAPGEGRLKTQSWDIPTTFRLGAAMTLIKKKNYSLVYSMDGVHSTDAKEVLNSGFELNIGSFVFRNGFGIGYDQNRISFGGGYSYKRDSNNFYTDYAALIINPFGLIQAVSLRIDF
ncbi:MAG: hypothetical protein CMG74_00200 [Candidatus Marinimicrobia bacterium]|nr:hypothetical protein [Candidatus Neomarinimicrobiota bacterium]|tara:strand:+ start:1305 stop:2306 length:1002 start_codon:yes stop_codon:yes gene_type:complete